MWSGGAAASAAAFQAAAAAAFQAAATAAFQAAAAAAAAEDVEMELSQQMGGGDGASASQAIEFSQ